MEQRHYSKTPVKTLYLETGNIPIRFVLIISEFSPLFCLQGAERKAVSTDTDFFGGKRNDWLTDILHKPTGNSGFQPRQIHRDVTYTLLCSNAAAGTWNWTGPGSISTSGKWILEWYIRNTLKWKTPFLVRHDTVRMPRWRQKVVGENFCFQL